MKTNVKGEVAYEWTKETIVPRHYQSHANNLFHHKKIK